MTHARVLFWIAPFLLSACAAVGPQGFGASQTRYGPSAGKSLVTAGGSVRNIETDVGGSTVKDTFYELNVGYGHFLTGAHEVGAQLAVNALDSNTPDDELSLSILPYYNYNYRYSAQTWFYGGVRAGLRRTKTETASSSDDFNGLEWGLQIGWRQWLTPKASFFVEPRYTQYDIEVANTKLDATEFGMLFGFALAL